MAAATAVIDAGEANSDLELTIDLAQTFKRSSIDNLLRSSRIDLTPHHHFSQSISGSLSPEVVPDAARNPERIYNSSMDTVKAQSQNQPHAQVLLKQTSRSSTSPCFNSNSSSDLVCESDRVIYTKHDD